MTRDLVGFAMAGTWPVNNSGSEAPSAFASLVALLDAQFLGHLLQLKTLPLMQVTITLLR